ncbi:MAG: hypothetical protein CVV64_05930 [Candidatus Wallbacteria bacterium HGW-Wallbacteria-1]|jgi:hypothetical protein|uniref:ATP synthase subunit I n=1 Tax=Candidatus Wallbacteria bacterium HGW-Wallbacteria-1 TaxID=2013854 RepID=A0A2N1PSI9_9BACT|nr:MAG: hypothetical protein CVV64_05930 [Candidatus Wallbacteria bacterium HGW-Wallbacteria-1]
MEEHSVYCRKTVKLTLQLALIPVLLLFSMDKTFETRGLILGILASVLDFQLMAWSVSGIDSQDGKKSLRRLRFSLLGRYVIIFAAMMSAWFFPTVNFLFLCIGLFAVKLTIFMRHVVFFRADSLIVDNEASATDNPADEVSEH